jgi:hypothetical protein
MPFRRDDRRVTCLDRVPHLASLPVPKADKSTRISTGNNATVRRHVNINRVTGIVVPSEVLLAVLANLVSCRVDLDGVVGRLQEDVALGVCGGFDHREHVRLGDELDGDGNAVLPCAQRLVVGGCDEPAVLVAECDCVDGTILLSCIPARNSLPDASSGCHRTTCGVEPVVNRPVHCPVSVSQTFICLS